MAAARTKATPVGSGQWVLNEQQQAADMVEQEVDEYGYSVRNELEWLNEHMADIFSTSAVNFADVFKTPGKLRAKTPRTARKRDAGPQRQPLSDIFAPNSQADIFAPNTQNVPTPAKNTAFYDKVTHFQIAEDGQHLGQQTRPLSRGKSPQRMGKPGNTDSGYHGMTEDEMEVDAQDNGSTVPSQENEAPPVSFPEQQEASPRPDDIEPESERVSDESSFVSAKEGLQSRKESREVVTEEPEVESDNATVPDEEMVDDEPEHADENAALADVREDDEDNIIVSSTREVEEPIEEVEAEPTDQDLDADLSHPASEASSPAKPLQRKSSFNFSSLPAREPLSKRSFGVRESQYDPQNRNSVLARSLGKSFGAAQLDDGEHSQEKSEETKLHGKTSTQLLHERISMLGKTKEPRPSKSIPQAALYPQLPQAEDEIEEEDVPPPPPKDVLETAPMVEEDDDDDWIAPKRPTQPEAPVQSNNVMGPPARPAMHQKSISTTKLPSPTREIMAPVAPGHQKAMSVSSKLAPTLESTTPAGSPVSKKHPDAPMSASKKLWTAFKSARNLFASSAGSSAAAKLEAHSNSPAVTRKQKRDFSDESKTAAVINMPGALYSQTQFPQSPSRPVSVVSASPSRKTRSSTESDKRREKETKAQAKAANELDKAREKERQKAAKAQEEKVKADSIEAAKRQKQDEAAAAAAAAVAERPASATSDKDREDMPPPPPPKSMLPAGKLRAPGRLMRPVREAAAKAKPAPVNIRVASQSQRLNQAPSFTREDSLAPPPPPKTGLRTNSAQSNARSSTMPQNNSRVKALEAAARKKELEEKEKLRKAEQKRDLERKRAAKVEEERRAEQERKAEEQRRMQEAKQAAQRQAEKQAAEAKRREQVRLEQQRLEQQRQQEAAAQKAKAAHELAEAIQRERAQQQAQRGDLGVGGTLRQLAAKTVNMPHPQPNAAKPAKRNFPGAEEEEQRPGMQRAAASYQQNEAKRRKTDELAEQDIEPRHSVMAPPKRPSTMRKETLTKFPHGYSHAPPPAAHHGNAASASIFKSTVTAQHQRQVGGPGGAPSHPSQTVQLSSARIPFADASNSQQPQPHDPRFKTPSRPNPTSKPKSAAKSSPMYPNGDSIALPEIMTDSEDSDDSDSEETQGFRAPSWVASPALRDLLTQQQLVDPETVFGPIAELKMDEVFRGKGQAERVKRFRDRGSSAMWAETGDALTVEERRRDLEGRERMVREGGWRYEGAGAGGAGL